MKVFVSSVIRGYERYRAAAKKAISLLGHVPIVSEEFGARPYSSQQACLTEIDQADAVVLILGVDFGFETPSGESVTQQEFRRAKASGKPILAFLEDVSAEGLQKDFRREVSDYIDGLFRVTFINENELSDGIVHALSHFALSRNAVTEQKFVQQLAQRPSDSYWGSQQYETRLELAFLPQPELFGTLRLVHEQHDSFFLKLCQARLCLLKEGYKDYDQGDLTGLDTPRLRWRYQDGGLTWISIALVSPTKSRNPFGSQYISPSHVKEMAQAAISFLNEEKGGWFQLGVYGVGYKIFAEIPEGVSNTISVPFRSEQSFEDRKLLIPATPSSLSCWLEDALFRIGRKIAP